MTIRRFRLDSGLDVQIKLDIDTSIVTEEIANQVVTFWASWEEVAEVSGNVWEGVARYAASRLIPQMLDGYTPNAALRDLHDQEGWCWPGAFGITIVDYDLPDFSPDEFECNELEVPSE